MAGPWGPVFASGTTLPKDGYDSNIAGPLMQQFNRFISNRLQGFISPDDGEAEVFVHQVSSLNSPLHRLLLSIRPARNSPGRKLVVLVETFPGITRFPSSSFLKKKESKCYLFLSPPTNQLYVCLSLALSPVRNKNVRIPVAGQRRGAPVPRKAQR